MKNSLTSQDLDLIISDSAVRQIQLIQENDYTLHGLCFRIKIGGKGCDGFTYETGFSAVDPQDLIIKKEFPLIAFHLEILMDPFTAFYSQKVELDYLFEETTNEEGFVVKNSSQKDHRGKFFKDESKLPPWAKK
jgi:Fe-S cluster assembly iron-binding protein IscA